MYAWRCMLIDGKIGTPKELDEKPKFGVKYYLIIECG